ncbi:diguanylate cyclase [Cupriavidus sp. USMAA2-4]|uniref:Diguanylate cyclase n=1 Tax=Cupriavidus malaysiensis TaxID=367825 RepID=A0ABM7D7U2_9BURK|nr:MULTISPECIES: phosphodiesterase [Cupriavidus]AOY96234.1 diguanylate cyclase [Cupriavidus sp. USMAA2-4]AOZ03362.1 diguanylate cyclase [Cupriavidus sp. USMAHM13]AOZ09275.1 diguanylate cyclase [Cupriavidus malaysiensis]
MSTAASAPALRPALPGLPPVQAVFQPIVQLHDAALLGYEALVRGPEGSPYASPDALFGLAHDSVGTIALELHAARAALASWQEQGLPGRLFLNFSPLSLRHLLAERGRAMGALLGQRAPASRVVIEVTEQTPIGDAAGFAQAMEVLRAMGLQYALDDFGTGHANLDLLAHLSPHYVKIDKSLIRGIATCSRRLEILRAVLRMVSAFSGHVIAEGVEEEDEFAVLRDLGVSCAQGFYLGRPQARPVPEVSPHALRALASRQIAVFPQMVSSGWSGLTAGALMRDAPTMRPATVNDEVLGCFHAHPDLHAVAVVDEAGKPLAIINRQHFIDRYAAPFHRELYGRKACVVQANREPICFDRHVSVEEMAQVLARASQRALADGFIVTEQGRYAGIGTGAELVRAITDIRMQAARHANPLTLLPGNIPLNQHIDRLIASGNAFHACYVDLNHFKPYNDQYGYWKGDEMLKGAAAILAQACDPARDFLGHVGGDDFLVLYQSADWAERVRAAIDSFNAIASAMYPPQARAAGGIHAEDRLGRKTFFPTVSMAVGVVRVGASGMASLRRQGSSLIGSAAAAAKREAKRAPDGLAIIELNAADALRSPVH